MSAATAAGWQGFAQSARGSSHERHGTPNQDAGIATPLDAVAGMFLAVADGHGDALHARSDRGSRFAIAAARQVFETWFGGVDATRASAASRGIAALPALLTQAWQDAVDADLAADPAVFNSPATQQEPRLLYGSTLVIACLTERFAVYAQVGDGDIVVVEQDGASRHILPLERAGPINVTDSLCQADAAERFRVVVEDFGTAGAPALVLLSTDGYANSFSDEAAFLRVGGDLRNYIAKDGVSWVESQMAGWLAETTRAGSGDDITLALAARGGLRERVAGTTATTAGSPSTTMPAASAIRRRSNRAAWSIALFLVLIAGAAIAARVVPSLWPGSAPTSSTPTPQLRPVPTTSAPAAPSTNPSPTGPSSGGTQ